MFCVVEQMPLSPNVPAQKIRDQFTGSFSGGSNYWLQAAKLMKADNVPSGRPWYSCPEVFEGAFAIELGFDNPNEYEGMGNGRKTITDADVPKAFEVMRRDHPKAFAAMMNGTGDADTADVFLQCCLFGKVVYG
jgi:hypothetical protein